MSSHAGRDWRDIVALEFLEAIDAGDAETIALLWERATEDPELEEFLRELGKGLYELEGPGAGFEADADRVRAMAFKHLLAYEPPAPPAGPLTAADVAGKLQADADLGSRLDASDRIANAALLGRPEPLPDPPRLSALESWGRSLGVSASPRYWSAFREAVVMLLSARGTQEERLAAARLADPKADRPGGAS